MVHSMDLTTTIAELRREKEKLDRVIAFLEELPSALTGNDPGLLSKTDPGGLAAAYRVDTELNR